MESSIEIEERAGRWLTQRESGHWSAEDEARFTQWLAASTANRVAFLRQEAAWEYAVRLQALKGNTPDGEVPATEDWRLTPFFSDGQSKAGLPPPSASANFSPGTGEGRVRVPKARVFALAASVLLAIAASITWHFWSQGRSYRTPIGVTAAVPLPDGSKITLNTDSEIHVAVTEKERRIELNKGEAFFKVAKDPDRPFIVIAGNRRVIAVGTAFSVRRQRNDIHVLVTEGKVRIESENLIPRRATTTPLPGREREGARGAGRVRVHKDGPAKREDEGPRGEAREVRGEVFVTAGSIARAGDAGVIVQQNSLPEIEDYLSWRAGYLVFRETSLADAIAEFNRYNEQKILIQDPAVAAIRFSGKIRPTSFEPFIRLLEDSFPIKAQHGNGRILLTAAN